MRQGTAHRTTILVIVLLVSAAPATAAVAPTTGADTRTAASRPASFAGATIADQSPELRLVQELRLTPEQPGEIEVRLRYDLPDQLAGLVAVLPPEATVRSTDGFHARDGQEYEWDGRTASPAITYRLPANETGQVRGPEGAEGQYLFVDVGEWALVERPRVGTSWRWSGAGRVQLSRTATVDGPGAVGGSTAFLGEHRERHSTAHGQTFRLIVPAASDMREPPEAVLEAFAAASDALRVGDRDESVFAVVAPTGRIEWSARGLQIGDADLWVLDDEPLDDPGDTWTHEYVHTRQSFETTTTGAWVTEAMAVYYAALLAVRDGRVGFDAFDRRLGLGARSPYGDAVLADPTTWRGARPDYLKGALVFGELDRQLRLATDRERTMQSVFRWLNERDEPTSWSSMSERLGAFGGENVSGTAERYVTTAAVPDTWSRAAHDEAFGPSPSVIDVAIGDEYGISGPYRNGSASGTPAVLAIGETLSIDVRVENVGGTAGPYETALRVDGDVEARRTGRLEPGASTNETFDRAFDETGTYTVAAGTEALRVDVVEPATASVADVRATRASVRIGETVTVSATVRNDAAIPGEREVEFRRNGTVVDRRLVRLGPGESRSVSFSATIDSPDEHRFEIAGDSVVVRGERATHTDTDAAPDDRRSPADDVAVTPGTLAVVLVVALVGIAVLLAVRRRRR